MPLDAFAILNKLPVFAMVASRLGGMIMFQPVLKSLAVPLNLRVLFVLGLAALVTPMIDADQNAPQTLAGLAVALLAELALGMLIGAILTTCFLGLELGGLMTAQQAGLAFGQIADPNSGEQNSVFGVFYVQLGVVMYMVLGGHRAILLATLGTFRRIPLLADVSGRIDVDLLVLALTLGTEVAIRVAAPAVITILLVNVAIGFISRTVPQLNIATVGFGLKSMVGLTIMAVSLPAVMNVFIHQLDAVVGWVETLTLAAPAVGP